MEDYQLIKYKFDQGIYDLKAMMALVDAQVITKRYFSEITRYDYDGLKAVIQNSKYKNN